MLQRGLDFCVHRVRASQVPHAKLGRGEHWGALYSDLAARAIAADEHVALDAVAIVQNGHHLARNVLVPGHLGVPADDALGKVAGERVAQNGTVHERAAVFLAVVERKTEHTAGAQQHAAGGAHDHEVARRRHLGRVGEHVRQLGRHDGNGLEHSAAFLAQANHNALLAQVFSRVVPLGGAYKQTWLRDPNASSRSNTVTRGGLGSCCSSK